MALTDRSSLHHEEQEARLTATAPGNARLWAMVPEGTVRRLPSELPERAAVTSGRFRRRIDTIHSANEDGLSKPGEEVFELIERYAPADANREDILEQALLIESAHAELSDLTSALRRGPERLPTSKGDLIVLRSRVLSTSVTPDVANVRAEATNPAWNGEGGADPVPPVLDERDSESGERELTFIDGTHFSELNNKQRTALGFTGNNIRDERNRYDIEHLARQGVQKEILIAPTRLVDEATKARGLVLSTINGARRTTMCQYILETRLPGVPIRRLALDHLLDAQGVPVFRRLSVEDVDAVRDKVAGAIAQFAGPGLSGGLEADQQRLHDWASRLDRASEAAIRVLTEPAMIVIGVDRDSVMPDVEYPLTECVDAFTATLHVPEQSDLDWGPKPIQLTVARSILRRVPPDALPGLENWARGLVFNPRSFSWRSGGIRSTVTRKVAEAVDGVDTAALAAADPAQPVPLSVLPDMAPAVASGTPLTTGKLEVMLAATAVMVCRGHSFAQVVAEELAAKGMPNSPKQRGQLMAAAVLGLVNLPLTGTIPDRVHAAVSRTPNHSIVYKLEEAWDPLDEGLTWVDLIGHDWLEIAERADREADAIARRAGAGTNSAGPAQTILALAAAYALSVSPATIATDHQLTQSGLGKRRGDLAAEPLTVVLPLANDPMGRRQLLEIIVALVNDDRPYVPRSVKFGHGEPDAHHFGPLLTEYDLRGRTWNPDQGDDNRDDARPRIGAAESNERLFHESERLLTRMSHEFAQVANPASRREADPDLDDADGYGGSVAEAFYNDGIDLDVVRRMQRALERIVDVVATGKAIRTIAISGQSAGE